MQPPGLRLSVETIPSLEGGIAAEQSRDVAVDDHHVAAFRDRTAVGVPRTWPARPRDCRRLAALAKRFGTPSSQSSASACRIRESSLHEPTSSMP